MRLVLRKHTVTAIALGAQTSWERGVLTVNPAETAAMFPQIDGLRLAGVHAVAPGSSVRLGPVLDVVGLRCGHDGPAFPGVTGPLPDTETRRITLLDKAGLCVVSNLPGVQEGVIDMASSWSPLAALHLLVCRIEVSPVLEREKADAAIRLFQCCLAEKLAALARDQALGEEDVEEEILEWQADGADAQDLPRVGAVYFIQAQGALRRTFYYGQAADTLQPRLVDPLECLGGALTSGNYVMPGNKTCTYIHHQAPIVRELLARHGRDWRFAAVILANEASTVREKEENVKAILALARDLRLEGLIINQEGGGNADLDLMQTCAALEKAGMATVLVVNEFAGPEGKTPSLTEYVPQARHMVSAGNNDFPAALAPVGECIGFAMSILPGQAATGEAVLPLSRHYASTNQLGFGRLSCESR